MKFKFGNLFKESNIERKEIIKMKKDLEEQDCFADARNDERMTMDLTTDESDLTRISKFARLTKKFNPLLLQARVNKTVKNLFTYSPINLFTNNKTVSAHSPFTTHHSRKRCAFTLAEVLITLGIIGVVAAMTMPTLIQKHQEQVTVTRVKKFYSLINQTLLMAIKDNGYVDEWNFIESDEDSGNILSDKFAGYFKPYLKIAKDCGSNAGCLGYTKKVNLLSGAEHNTNYEINKSYYKMILTDGTYMWMRRDWGTETNSQPCNDSDGGLAKVCGAIWIDINGKTQPNTIGKDIFIFYIQKNRIMPSLKNDCKADNNGWGCTNYILQYGNMNYLHK